MREVIRTYQDACSGPVARYDGFIAKCDPLSATSFFTIVVSGERMRGLVPANSRFSLGKAFPTSGFASIISAG
jgi:hypothetical protein